MGVEMVVRREPTPQVFPRPLPRCRRCRRRHLRGVSLSTDHRIAGPSSDTVSSSDSSDKPLRKGKWTAERSVHVGDHRGFFERVRLASTLVIFLIRLFLASLLFCQTSSQIACMSCAQIVPLSCSSILFLLLLILLRLPGVNARFVVYLDSRC